VVSKNRALRISDRIRDELATILLYEISDPRLSGVSVTDVTVDRELSYANVFVSALEGSERSEEILTGLNHAQGFLRRELAQRIDLFTFPKLRFYWDPTSERAEKIERLILSLHEGDNTPEPDGTNGPESDE
jgi:ribosome-binding factor A